MIAHSAYWLGQLVLLNPALQELADIVDKEARWWLVRLLALIVITFRLVAYLKLISYLIAHWIEIRLRDVLTVTDVEATERVFLLEICIVDLDLLLRDLNVIVVAFFAKLVLEDLESVDRTIIFLRLIDLNLFHVDLVVDQLYCFDFLGVFILQWIDGIDARLVLLYRGDDERVDFILFLESSQNLISDVLVVILI